MMSCLITGCRGEHAHARLHHESRVKKIPKPAGFDHEAGPDRDDGREAVGQTSATSAADTVLALQALAGNGAVTRLLSGATPGVQFKLAVGAASDPLEREADRVAERVVGSPGQQVSAPPQSSSVDSSAGQGAVASPGKPLPAATREHLEPAFGQDFSGVRVHTDGAAAQAAEAVRARAYTIGRDIVFGAGQYAPGTAEGDRLLAHELTHTIQQAGGDSSVLRRKEVDADADIAGRQDWTTADREGNTQRWKDACLANLNAVDSSQYVKIVERRDFYKWFYEYSASVGFTTRWALAAYVVANGAHQIADMDLDHAIANDTFSLAGIELQGAMREGNQVIFDNVLPKLKRLIDGGPLQGRAALEWDMRILSEEQVLVQPLYSRMSSESIEQMDYIARKTRLAGVGAWWTEEDRVPAGPHNNAGTVPPFDQPSLLGVENRWRYGMGLGSQFTPGGTGFDPAVDGRPPAGVDYWNGAELAKVDTRGNLHELDAWLNPNRLTRTGPEGRAASTFLQAIVARLTPFERQQILADRSADGWAYSVQLAQFGFVTEALVTQALPDDPQSRAAVGAFLARFRAERARVERATPAYPIGPF
jgi:Domain of unknown function (DUF4157)